MSEEEEELLFEIKSRFFRDVPHPKLILKALSQLNQGKQVSAQTIPHVSELNFADLELSLSAYMKEILYLKTKLSHADRQETISLIEQMFSWHSGMISKLATYVTDLNDAAGANVKQSDPIRAYEVSEFLKSEGILENEIKGYICTQLEHTEPAQWSVLTKACLQCQKIIQNG